MHSLRKFASSPAVYEIVVALRKDEIAGFRTQVEKEYPEILNKRLQFVEGGEHRQDSVANALAKLAADAEDIVLVHDAVRPFVTPEIILHVIEAAEKHHAAIAGWPAVDTVKQVERTAEGAVIKATIPRASVVMAQTPQGFRYDVLKKGFEDAAADGFLGTDEASLIERAGFAGSGRDGLAAEHQDHDSRGYGTGGVLSEGNRTQYLVPGKIESRLGPDFSGVLGTGY